MNQLSYIIDKTHTLQNQHPLIKTHPAPPSLSKKEHNNTQIYIY